jgi:protein-tyrosine-phosphatase
MKVTILFVCTANMCRSPMAEGLMRRKLEQEGRADDVRAASAGVWTVDGRPATQGTVLTMAELDVDIRRHRSRVITERIIENAALILAMTQSHADALKAEFPAHADRIYLLSEMVGYAYDIEDPVGGTLLDYEETALEIEAMIEHGFPKMMELIGLPVNHDQSLDYSVNP